MTDDPFDRLVVAADTDQSVDPLFAARLRARLERALGVSADEVTVRLPGRSTEPSVAATAVTSTTTDHPERNSTMSQVITPYLCVHDATTALAWYREHFGASVGSVIEWEGKVGHAEVDISGAVFYLSDEAPGLGVVAPERNGSRTSVSVVVQVAAVEEFVARAVDGGAVLQREIEVGHGSRSAWLVDPFGHRWNVGTPVDDR